MKKIIVLSLALVLILSLAACRDTVNDVTSGAESMGDSIASGTESAADKAESSIKDKTDDDTSMNLMAGITASDAKKAALEHAGLGESQISGVSVDLDRDNGKLIYEVNFNYGDIGYNYDIDAETGEVISSHTDKD